MIRRWAAGLFLVLLVNTAYIASVASPTIFYMMNVLLHVVLGVAAAVAFVVLLARDSELRRALRIAASLLLLSGAFGLFLTIAGAVRANRWALWAHIALGVAGVVALLIRYRQRAPRVIFGAGLVVPLAAFLVDRPGPASEVRNPPVTPLSMQQEGAGPESPFWPASAQTVSGGFIPEAFFLSSKKCAECHEEIYNQWNSSAHHFASFNNQFYRKSIEHMQEISGGTKSSRWCAGCHDHAVLFSGKWDTPIIEQMDTPAAQAGLSCLSCHGIVHVDGTMGNSSFTIKYPELHNLMVSDNPLISKMNYFMTFLEPEPHRRVFLKPFMKDSAEFCAPCHKVHLDVPVNNYRWLRGFNDYDNWQASGVSGQGARSFYYPDKPMVCADCHMPLVPVKDDPAARNGMVHSHRFPAANMALPYVNRDDEQLKTVESFLKSGFITVDIFAASPVEEGGGLPMMRRAGEGPQLMSTFAVGEEAEQARQVIIREVGQVAAPLDKAGAVFRPGETIRVDVVVRTRKIGHFFPAGTVDAFDVWLELQAKDANGRTIFWSGKVEDDGRGPVEEGAHFYRSYMLDGAGNPVNKRNAWQTRSLLYVRLIPPGAADVAHYRIQIPEDASGPITLTTKLNYRKFSHYYTQYAYAGKPVEGENGESVNVHHDSREYTFDPADIPANVAGKIKGEIPNLPIVTMAEAKATLQVGGSDTDTVWRPVVRKEDRERWNDWGIGMLLQGDLKGAEYAFKKATEAEPEYADGWLNVARALIQEGETEAAKPYIQKALEVNPKLGRIHFFKAMIQKADGDYEGAVKSLRYVESLYPRDRVVLNQIGRVLFLTRDYSGAVEALEKVLAVDPEDLQAHYTLMLAYRGLGDVERAAREQELFLRFKADESAQTITARRRRLSPEDNNERQALHDHVSVPSEAAN